MLRTCGGWSSAAPAADLPSRVVGSADGASFHEFYGREAEGLCVDDLTLPDRCLDVCHQAPDRIHTGERDGGGHRDKRLTIAVVDDVRHRLGGDGGDEAAGEVVEVVEADPEQVPQDGRVFDGSMGSGIGVHQGTLVGFGSGLLPVDVCIISTPVVWSSTYLMRIRSGR